MQGFAVGLLVLQLLLLLGLLGLVLLLQLGLELRPATHHAQGATNGASSRGGPLRLPVGRGRAI